MADDETGAALSSAGQGAAGLGVTHDSVLLRALPWALMVAFSAGSAVVVLQVTSTRVDELRGQLQRHGEREAHEAALRMINRNELRAEVQAQRAGGVATSLGELRRELAEVTRTVDALCAAAGDGCLRRVRR